MANKYALAPASVQLASGTSVFVDAGSLWDSASAVVVAAPALFTTWPALPASATPLANPNPVPISVTISGGTVTAISINGGASVGIAGTFTLQPGWTIAVTYSVAPTWTVADLPPVAGYPFVNSVLAGYLTAYPNGPQVH